MKAISNKNPLPIYRILNTARQKFNTCISNERKKFKRYPPFMTIKYPRTTSNNNNPKNIIKIINDVKVDLLFPPDDFAFHVKAPQSPQSHHCQGLPQTSGRRGP